MMYLTVNNPAPILNTPHFKKVYGLSLPFSHQNLVNELEYIALPNQILEVVGEEGDNILQVKTPMYPSKVPLYVDSRFGKIQAERDDPPKITMPSSDLLLKRLLSKEGLPYVWGGNWSSGIPKWEKLYPPPACLSPFEKIHWTFKGLDCSGLLYEAAEGLTPRNTSELMTFGKEVLISELKPLDLILHKGHVLIAISPTEVIESKHSFGKVTVSPLQKRLDQINDPLVFRRFLEKP